MRPARRVIIIHAQPTSSPPKPIASSSRSGVMRNNISNGKSAGGVRLSHHNLSTTAAPTPSRKQPRDTEGGFTHALLDRSAEPVDAGRRSAKPRSPTVQSIEPACARPVV